MFNHLHYNHLTVSPPGQPGQAGTRKVKPIWILLEHKTVSGSGISWAICKSAPRSRQTTTPAPHHSVFTGRMPFLPPNQQRQSTEGTAKVDISLCYCITQCACLLPCVHWYFLHLLHRGDQVEWLITHTRSARGPNLMHILYTELVCQCSSS